MLQKCLPSSHWLSATNKLSQNMPKKNYTCQNLKSLYQDILGGNHGRINLWGYRKLLHVFHSCLQHTNYLSSIPPLMWISHTDWGSKKPTLKEAEAHQMFPCLGHGLAFRLFVWLLILCRVLEAILNYMELSRKSKYVLDDQLIRSWVETQ